MASNVWNVSIINLLISKRLPILNDHLEYNKIEGKRRIEGLKNDLTLSNSRENDSMLLVQPLKISRPSKTVSKKLEEIRDGREWGQN